MCALAPLLVPLLAKARPKGSTEFLQAIQLDALQALPEASAEAEALQASEPNLASGFVWKGCRKGWLIDGLRSTLVGLTLNMWVCPFWPPFTVKATVD